jgi:large subunit ribosomal protein L13
VLAKRPERVIKEAVWGMIPHNKLGKQMIKKLKVFGGAEHEHAAQRPQPLEIKG